MRINNFTKTLCGVALSLFVGGSLASCSSELDEPAIGNNGNMILSSPKVVAYSGNHFWTGGSLTRSGNTPLHTEEEVVKFAYAEATIDRQAEQAKIDAFLPEQNVNLFEKVDDDFLYYAKDGDISFEIFPIVTHTSYNPNYLGVFYFDEFGEKHEVLVWDALNPYDLTRTDYNVYPAVTYSKGVHVTIKKGYKFGFFWGGRYYPVDGHGYNDADTKFYSDSQLNEYSYVFENGNVNLNHTSRVHAITFELDGHTYLGLEDWADFDFQDLVFSADTSLPTVDEEDKLPDLDEEEPGLPEKPDAPEQPEYPSQPENPSNPEVPVSSGDEVEINLALDDKDGRYLESHLSMHVRSATDVEIFIPVPAKYYCDTDDMNIMLDKVENFVHGGPYTTEINIGGSTVYVNVQFKDDGIRIFTDGINDFVIEYCRENYNDGLTIEVWNYFNDPEKVGDFPISMEELKVYMDKATVKFLDKIPDAYINAFGVENGKYGDGGTLDGKDFHVTPEDQLNRFDAPYEGSHLNGSDFNDIYHSRH